MCIYPAKKSFNDFCKSLNDLLCWMILSMQNRSTICKIVQRFSAPRDFVQILKFASLTSWETPQPLWKQDDFEWNPGFPSLRKIVWNYKRFDGNRRCWRWAAGCPEQQIVWKTKRFDCFFGKWNAFLSLQPESSGKQSDLEDSPGSSLWEVSSRMPGVSLNRWTISQMSNDSRCAVSKIV